MPVDTTALDVAVNLDIKTAIQQVARFEKAMARAMGGVTKAVEGLGKSSKKMATESEKGSKAITKGYEAEEKQLDALALTIKGVEKRLEGASGTQKKVIQNQLKDLKKLQAETKKTFGAKDLIDAKSLAKEAGKGLQDAVGGFKSSLTSFLSKDFKGTVEGSLKGATKTFSSVLSGAAAGLKGAGGGLKMAGAGIGARGKAKGGAGGLAMQGAGAGLKGIGKVLGGVSKMVGMFAKLGPIISMVGTALFAVVQILVDIEAKGKQFQKELLESASTAEFLGDMGWNAGAAYGELADTMASLRDAAHDVVTNLELGITADQHKAMLNTLTQEGVTFAAIAQNARAAKMEAGDFEKQLITINVAYSRLLGVPMQQISELQAEMMTELGMGLEQTRLAFAQITRASTDSGIAANKFYAIIRGVSQDLSLYNVRMGSAVKMLKLLGKAMNPRNAQKFMQTLTQGLKQMGTEDRMKMMMLAGPKGQKILQKDLNRRQEQVAKDIAEATGKTFGEIQSKLKDKKYIRGVLKGAGAKRGALTEEYTETMMDVRASKKGIWGQAVAAGNVGMGAAYEMRKAALGGGTMSEKVGELGFHKFAELLNISEEELRNNIKLEGALEMQREDLLEAANDDLKRATTDGQKREAEAKLQKIRDMDAQDLIDTMSKEEQKQLEDEAKTMEDFAKEQTGLTSSLLDKFGVLVDFLMNQVYNILIGIWESITDWFGSDEDQKKIERVRAVKGVGGVGGKQMEKYALEGVGKPVESGIVKAMDKALSEQQKLKDEAADEARVIALAEKQKKTAPGEWTPKMQKDLEARKEQLKAKQEKIHGVQTAKEKALSGLSQVAVSSAAGMAGGKWQELSGVHSTTTGRELTKADAFARALSKGYGIETAKREAGGGITDEMVNDLIRKIPWVEESKGGGAPVMEALAEAGNKLDEAGYDISEQTAESTKKTADATAELADAGTKEGTLITKFSKSFLNSDFKKVMEDAILKSVREALFEYYLYSGFDPADLVKQLPTMGGITGLAEKAKSYAAQGRDLGGVLDLERTAGDDEEGGGDGKPKKEPKKGGRKVLGITLPSFQGGGAVPGPANVPVPALMHGGEFVVPRGGALVGGGAAGGKQTVEVMISLDPNAGRLIRATAADEMGRARKRERTGY